MTSFNLLSVSHCKEDMNFGTSLHVLSLHLISQSHIGLISHAFKHSVF